MFFIIKMRKIQKVLPLVTESTPSFLVKQVCSDDNPATKKSEWSKHQVVVTKYSEDERFGSAVYNLYGGPGPAHSFDDYVKNNEPIENEDIVAWVTIGGLHIPTSEDIPSTCTIGNQFNFFLRPFNFFSEDPSLSSRDGVYVKQGTVHTDKFTVPDDGSCGIPKRDFWY